VPQRRATSLVATPSPASSNALACITLRCDSEDDLAIVSSAMRCSSVMGNAAATTVGMVAP